MTTILLPLLILTKRKLYLLQLFSSDLAYLNTEENSSNTVHVISEDIDGRVKYTGYLVRKEEELFQIIINKVSYANSCDMHPIFHSYLDQTEKFRLMLIFFIFEFRIYDYIVLKAYVYKFFSR